jgi:hypothetical protein
VRRKEANPGETSKALPIDAEADQRSAAKEKTEWRVRHILAVVDLKSEWSACAEFSVQNMANPPIIPAASILTSGRPHGALGQALMYSLSHALRGWAAMGIRPPDSKLLTAVVACKSEKRPSGTRNHWALAHLAIPDDCGGRLTFGVRAFGSSSHSNFEAASLALYLRVMADSLKNAMAWLKAIRETRRLRAPILMSGRTVKFGVVSGKPIDLSATDMELVATPVTDCGNGLKISQGELLQATLDLGPLAGRESICILNAPRDANVLIKVTSAPCFNMLLERSESYLFELAGQRSLDVAIAQLLEKSLYAVYKTGDKTGLIQILPDLRCQGFGPLRPKDFIENLGYTWDTIWTAFENFVIVTLMPLAKANIVHMDIRPGYDETSNVLYSPRNGGSLRMIDLDSLCKFAIAENILFDSDRYIKLNDLRVGNATVTVRHGIDYLYLWVSCIAEVWSLGRKSICVNANAILEASGCLLRFLPGETYSPVDETTILGVLGEYRDRFTRTGSFVSADVEP